jgi:hypothetical protein
MTTQGRRGGSRRSRTTDTQAAAPIAAIDTAALEPAAAHLSDETAELVEDTTVAITGGRSGGSLRRALPGAIVGALLVVGLTFGAAGPGGAFGPKHPDKSKDDAMAHAGSVGYTEVGDEADSDKPKYDGNPDGVKDDAYEHVGDSDTTDKPDADGETGEADKDEPDPTDKPAPEKTPKPGPEKTPKPAGPDPAPVEHIALGLGIKEFHPMIEWGSCAGLNFDYYKVVRSKDSTVAWPAGENDALVAAVERGGYRKAWDKDAPHGKKVWYRVFCVRKTDGGYKVVNSSGTKGIEVPEEPAPPDPITLGLEAGIDDEGKVALSWSACEVDGFAFYKVVKSTWNENPSYLPWTDGTEIVAVVSEMHATELLDWAPDPGVTVWYRVQCLGYVGDHKVLLGQSPVVSVTAP